MLSLTSGARRGSWAAHRVGRVSSTHQSRAAAGTGGLPKGEGPCGRGIAYLYHVIESSQNGYS